MCGPERSEAVLVLVVQSKLSRTCASGQEVEEDVPVIRGLFCSSPGSGANRSSHWTRVGLVPGTLVTGTCEDKQPFTPTFTPTVSLE